MPMASLVMCSILHDYLSVEAVLCSFFHAQPYASLGKQHAVQKVGVHI